jgi:hypothetical protein
MLRAREQNHNLGLLPDATFRRGISAALIPLDRRTQLYILSILT